MMRPRRRMPNGSRCWSRPAATFVLSLFVLTGFDSQLNTGFQFVEEGIPGF